MVKSIEPVVKSMWDPGVKVGDTVRMYVPPKFYTKDDYNPGHQVIDSTCEVLEISKT